MTHFKRLIATAALCVAVFVPDAPAIAQMCDWESPDYMNCYLERRRGRIREEQRDRDEWYENQRKNHPSRKLLCHAYAMKGLPCMF